MQQKTNLLPCPQGSSQDPSALRLDSPPNESPWVIGRFAEGSRRTLATKSVLRPIRHIILDRDGVLNIEDSNGGYVMDPGAFHWLKGAREALAHWRAQSIRVSVASNQSAIGRGLMSEAQLAAIHEKMNREALEALGSIDALYICPHAPEALCGCRKPAGGLIKAAIEASGISPLETILLGDDVRDLQAAQDAGIRAALVLTGKGRNFILQAEQQGCDIFEDLSHFSWWLENATPDRFQSLRRQFSEHIEIATRASQAMVPVLSRCAELLTRCIQQGGKVLACGNGGSAADAEHFVAEILGRFGRERRGMAAVALTAGSAAITAIANDFGYSEIFSRQIEAIAASGDVLLAVSTSGNSENVLQAARAARAKGCSVIALTGGSGGALAPLADLILKVPSKDTARVQEIHTLCLHTLAGALDAMPV